MLRGRLNRKNYVLGLAVSLLLNEFSKWFSSTYMNPSSSQSGFLVALTLLIAILTLVYIQITITVRRFHDTGKSGWFALLLLIPYVPYIITIYLLFAKPESKKNTYGSPPKPYFSLGKIFKD